MLDLKINMVNINDKTLTLILGIEKFILKNFKYNNIQMIVGSEFDYSIPDLNFIYSIIERYKISSVNIVGVSKTCTAGVNISSRLAKEYSELPINLFFFSPYTTVRKNFYVEKKILSKIPRSLDDFWEKYPSDNNFMPCYEVSNLICFENIRTFVIFPRCGVHCEPECAFLVGNQKNVTLVPLSLITHAVLFPFWNKLNRNMTIETFENEFSILNSNDAWYVNKFQKNFLIKDSLYRLIFDNKHFLDDLNTFNLKIKKLKIPLLTFLIYHILIFLMKTKTIVVKKTNKLRNFLDIFLGKFHRFIK